MKESKAVAIQNNESSIKCSRCGNEKRKFYLISSNLQETIRKIGAGSSKQINPISERQEYLAHIFEAQSRFGE